MVHLVEHCSANGEAMVLNPFEVPKFLFLGQFASDSINYNHHCDDYIFISVKIV